MESFAELLEKLVLTPSRNRKIEAMEIYFKNAPDPDRGYVLAALTKNLSIKNLKPAALKNLVMEHVDPQLFAYSYDYVGDMAETIALIWPVHKPGKLPAVSELITEIDQRPKKDLPVYIEDLLNKGDPNQRWALVKLITGGLRIGVSERLAKTALASYSGKSLEDIEKLWHGLEPPYENLFAWLDGDAPRPEIKHSQTFHPMMLSNPIDEDKDFAKLDPQDYSAEWKWDGIRVQLVFDHETARLFSRTGEDISAAFPDITENLEGSAVLDGELLVGDDHDKPLPFNCLQQRLNRKTPVKKHLSEYPAFIKAYDMLFDGEDDIRGLPLTERRKRLENFLDRTSNPRLSLSKIVPYKDWEELSVIRTEGANKHGHEGLMLKEKTSTYVAGRPRGPWFKWKRDPKYVDAILMYAQRGHGKRSSYYSDFTFGVWRGNEIVPIGKAYFGFTDEELKQLDKWVRGNTISRFGPVREVKKELVLEIAFDSAHESPRHKSGIAMRFPRISRIRWDKPADEVENLEAVKKALEIVSS